jgi:DinB superfamily
MDAREILIDAAGRPAESAHQVLKDISTDLVNRMPDGTHSSIAWLVWHSGRQMDAQLARLSGGTQVWQQDGWADRFALDRPTKDMGFGDGPADVAKVRVVDASLLSGYLEAVVATLVTYLRGLSETDLDDVIGHLPGPISRGVRIVSMIDDAVAHVSQAAYLRGLLENWTIGY